MTVQHGGHLALAAAAAGSALAELGTSLGGDLDLGHGALSSSQRAMRVRSVADNAGGCGPPAAVASRCGPMPSISGTRSRARAASSTTARSAGSFIRSVM